MKIIKITVKTLRDGIRLLPLHRLPHGYLPQDLLRVVKQTTYSHTIIPMEMDEEPIIRGSSSLYDCSEYLLAYYRMPAELRYAIARLVNKIIITDDIEAFDDSIVVQEQSREAFWDPNARQILIMTTSAIDTPPSPAGTLLHEFGHVIYAAMSSEESRLLDAAHRGGEWATEAAAFWHDDEEGFAEAFRVFFLREFPEYLGEEPLSPTKHPQLFTMMQSFVRRSMGPIREFLDGR